MTREFFTLSKIIKRIFYVEFQLIFVKYLEQKKTSLEIEKLQVKMILVVISRFTNVLLMLMLRHSFNVLKKI